MPTRVGTEFLVNSTTTSGQRYPSSAALANGGFVVAFDDNSEAEGAGIRYRLFDSSGAPIGPDMTANTTLAGQQQFSSIAALGDGFVILWQDSSQTGGDASGAAIRGQRFDASGTPQGSEFLVNSVTEGAQRSPQVTELPSGGFVVSWVTGSDGGDVAARIFDAQGAPAGPEFIVNTTTSNAQGDISVAALSGGGFVVTWQDLSRTGEDTDNYAVRAQRFDASGAPVGGEFLVNTTTAGQQSAPEVWGTSDGGFVVVFRDIDVGGSADSYSVRIQRYDAAGARAGGELTPVPPTTDFISAPDILVLGSGGHIILWQSSRTTGPDTSGSSVWIEEFDAGGASVGGPQLVNTTTAGGQSNPQLSLLSDGRVVVTWEDGSNQSGDPDGAGIVGQIFSTLATVALPGAGNDSLSGDADDNTIDGLGGDDTINGLGGDDVLYGGAGDDILDGGVSGLDRMYGGDGADRVSYASSLTGVQIYLDTQVSWDGVTMDFFESIENATGSDQNDAIFGSAEANELGGGGGDDLLSGGAGDDAMDGGAGDDTLDGGAGDDVLDGGVSGLDRLNGGEGADRVSYASSQSGVQVYLDTQVSWDGVTMDFFDSIENATGSDHGDVLLGSAGANALNGGGGGDILYGGADHDSLDGGQGDDVLYGEAGDDVLDGGVSGLDRLNGGDGSDRVSYASSVTGVQIYLDTQVSWDGVTMDFFESIENATGSDQNDAIFGSAEANELNGGGGDDFIDGGAGNDIVELRGLAGDYAITAVDGGYRVTDSVSGRDGSDLLSGIETLRFGDGTTFTLVDPASAAPVGFPALNGDKFASGPEILPTASEGYAKDAGPQIMPTVDDDFVPTGKLDADVPVIPALPGEFDPLVMPSVFDPAPDLVPSLISEAPWHIHDQRLGLLDEWWGITPPSRGEAWE